MVALCYIENVTLLILKVETELHVIILLYMLITTNCLGIVLTVVIMYTNYNVICQLCV